jgi:hypothetical protein
MPDQGRLDAHALDPLFALIALVFAAGVVSCFDVVAAVVPPAVHAGLLVAAFPLILITGYFESRIDHGDAGTNFPLWMRIRSRSLKWALTLGFTYLVIVLVQTLDWELGPIDPSPPLEWPPAARAAWFGGFSFGMFFANYLTTTSFLVPVLRALAWPARLLPTVLAVLLMTALGLGLGYGALQLVAAADAPAADNLVARARSLFADPTVGVLVTVALSTLLAILGALLGSRDRR